jgi:hypothetical protein
MATALRLSAATKTTHKSITEQERCLAIRRKTVYEISTQIVSKKLEFIQSEKMSRISTVNRPAILITLR